MRYYELLALDIDGTLVGSDQVVAREVLEALAAAQAAGLRVCLATGRSYVESVGIWRQLRLAAPPEPIVPVGGALVAEPDSGRTLYQKPIAPDVGAEFAKALNDLGYVAMVLVDGWRHDVDYLVSEAGDHHAASRQWFAKMAVRVRRYEDLAAAAARAEPLRISTVADPPEAERIAAELRTRFEGRLNVHAIVAPNYGVMIVEAHAPEANKLSALRYVAQGLHVRIERTAAVGDDINDLPMIRKVGLGVAMPASPPAVLEAADRVAGDGLAAFIQQLVAGRLDP